MLRVHGIRTGRHAAVYGCPKIENRGQIVLGDGVRLVSANRAYVGGNLTGPVFLRTGKEGHIVLGDESQLNGTTIISDSAVTIGKRVMVGTDTIILDTDLHTLAPEGRTRQHDDIPTAAVTIGDDVWVGSRTIILKGVTIGNGAVIGAGSVVSRNVPEMAVAAGNPARTIRDIEPNSDE